LAKLIAGLYAPSSGRLLVDDVPVQERGTKWFASQCSAIFSDFVIFPDVTECRGADVQEKAQNLLRRLHLEGRLAIEDLRFSRTTGLSSGERKRAALLMAIMEDRPIIILDEWAADQDATFKDIFYHEILPDLRDQGKLVIAISHDDRYFAVADKLIRLERDMPAKIAVANQAARELVE
jgi:putative ATP-binding cassette transporter